jgi:hypothetical protein
MAQAAALTLARASQHQVLYQRERGAEEGRSEKVVNHHIEGQEKTDYDRAGGSIVIVIGQEGDASFSLKPRRGFV